MKTVSAKILLNNKFLKFLFNYKIIQFNSQKYELLLIE